MDLSLVQPEQRSCGDHARSA